MKLARQRQDLLNDNVKIPAAGGEFIRLDKWIEYKENNLKDIEGNPSFYNITLYKTNDGGVRYPWLRVASVDLEFKEA